MCGKCFEIYSNNKVYWINNTFKILQALSLFVIKY